MHGSKMPELAVPHGLQPVARAAQRCRKGPPPKYPSPGRQDRRKIARAREITASERRIASRRYLCNRGRGHFIMTVKSRVRAAPHAALRMPRCGSAAARASMLARVRALGEASLWRPPNKARSNGDSEPLAREALPRCGRRRRGVIARLCLSQSWGNPGDRSLALPTQGGVRARFRCCEALWRVTAEGIGARWWILVNDVLNMGA